MHDPIKVRKVNGGANRDVDGEITGASDSNQVVDRRNMRPEGQVSKRIKGEEVFHDNKNVPFSYECIGAIEVNKKKVSIWADPAEDPQIIIDGVQVLKSSNFPVSYNKPLQLDKNEGCEGGEFSITDFNVRPMVFNVQDLLDSVGTQKYFNNFNLGDHLAGLQMDLNKPVAQGCVSMATIPGGAVVEGAGGLDAGMYQYAVRYVTAAGDKTNFTPNTGTIPVIKGIGSSSTIYPGTKRYGVAEGVNTTNGAHIRFRVYNKMSYEFVEVRRISYNDGTGIGFVPEAVIIAKIVINRNEMRVIDFVDMGAEAIEVVPDDQVGAAFSVINKAKSVRYYQNRLLYGNIEFASRDMSGITFDTESGATHFPVLKDIGKEGHSDPYHFANNPTAMHGERNGIGIVCYDGNFEHSFALKLDENYLWPNRRQQVITPTSTHSYDGLVTAANTAGAVGETHEIFTNETGSAKTDTTTAMNVYTGGGAHAPMHPVDDLDTDVSGHNYNPTPSVDSNSTTSHTFSPDGFAPTIKTMGIGVVGLQNIPNSVKAFSVVMTPDAKRVVAQGIGVYNLYDDITAGQPVKKRKDKVFFFSPDFANSRVDVQAIQDAITANPGQYKVQFVSPLGFFTEVYNAAESGGRYSNLDLISYASVVRETGTTMPGQTLSEVGLGSGYTAYGKWRNPTAPTGAQAWPSAGSGNKEIQINSLTIDENGGYIMELDEDVYNYNTGGSTAKEFDTLGAKVFHEPFYIINIIEDKSAGQGDVVSFVESHHIQKIESVIGIGSGETGQELLLVDERPDDCCNINDTSIDRFLYVRTASNGEETWLDVTNKSAAFITAELAAIAAGTSSYGGLYEHTTSGNDYIITFPHDLPEEAAEIVVKYNTNIPIQAYVGTAHHGWNITNTIKKNSTSEFSIGMPYFRNHINDTIKLTNTDSADPTLHDTLMHQVRQWCIYFLSTNRWATNFDFGNTSKDHDKQLFPNTHYVMRTQDGSTTNLYSVLYPADYPDDYANSGVMALGGIRHEPVSNIDYAHVPNKIFYQSIPDVGYKEQTSFCAGLVWSAPVISGQQNVPGSRTFPGLNFTSLNEQTGEIKYLVDLYDGNDEHLFAITERGIVRVLIGKNQIRDDSGNLVAVLSSDASFVQGQTFISKDQGCPDECWMGIAEHDNMVLIPNRESVWEFTGGVPRETLRIWAEGQLAYGYHTRVMPGHMAHAGYDFFEKLTHYIDPQKNEYGLQFQTDITTATLDASETTRFQVAAPGAGEYQIVDGGKYFVEQSGSPVIIYDADTLGTTTYLACGRDSDNITVKTDNGAGVIKTQRVLKPGDRICIAVNSFMTATGIEVTDVDADFIDDDRLFIYNYKTKLWTGEFDYRFDRYLPVGDRMFAFRTLKTFRLDVGDQISAANIIGELLMNAAAFEGSWFTRIRINSTIEPDTVEFSDTEAKADANTPDAIIDTTGTGVLHDRQGYENWIPRRSAGSRTHINSRELYIKITNQDSGDFEISTVGIYVRDLRPVT